MACSAPEKIAIIIPAYKTDFLRQTLDSIMAQTCRDFVVFIGDDCSKDNIKAIADEFSSKMPVEYVRFESNLGGKDLVAHWERCIALAGGYNWIWLFSDDDLMPADGVERVKAAILSNPTSEFFRFPLQVVNEKGAVISAGKPFRKAVCSAEEYLLAYFNGRRSSSVCEWVFSKRLFDELGMVHFPCAWCADIATWYSYAKHNGGMTNLSGACASWRNAPGVNISSTKGMYKEKMDALIQFIAWLEIHHGLPFSKELKKAISNYTGTILSVSLDHNFSKRDLLRLGVQLRPISRKMAYMKFIKYVFNNNL